MSKQWEVTCIAFSVLLCASQIQILNALAYSSQGSTAAGPGACLLLVSCLKYEACASYFPLDGLPLNVPQCKHGLL